MLSTNRGKLMLILAIILVHTLLVRFVSAQQSFLKFFGAGGNVCAFTVATSGSDIALAGTFNSGADHNLFITMNEDGSIRSSTGILVANEVASGTAKMIPTPEGGYFLAGGIVPAGQRSFDGLILKLDRAGSVLWAKTVGTVGTDQFFDAINVSDGFVLTGEVAGRTGADILIVKVSNSGKVVWRRVYGNSGRDLPVSITQTSDQGLLVTAAMHESNDRSPARAVLLKLNRKGRLVWARDIGPSNSSLVAGMFAVEMSDASLAFINYSISPTDTVGRIIFSKLASDGTMISSRSYSTTGGSLVPFTGLKTTDDGILLSGYVLTGAPAASNQSNRGVLLKIKSNGKIQWRRRLTLPNNPNLLFGASETIDGYVTTGCSVFDSAQDISLLRVQKNGHHPGVCSLVSGVPIRSAPVVISSQPFSVSSSAISLSISSPTTTSQSVALQPGNQCP